MNNINGRINENAQHDEAQERREILVDVDDDTFIHVVAADNNNNNSPTSITDTTSSDAVVVACGGAGRLRTKGGYSRVQLVSNEEEDEEFHDENNGDPEAAEEVLFSQGSSSSFWNRSLRILHTTLLPDDCGGGGGSNDNDNDENGNNYYSNFRLVESPAVVKLLKFCTLTFLGIALMHQVVRWMGWEHRESFTLTDFFTYESNLVFLDAIFFFTVGRMHRQMGVDHLAWIFFVCLANFYNSYITTFAFLRQSFTLYAMHCSWSVALWTFCLLVTPLIISLILLHVVYAVRHGVFGIKLVELLLSVILLLLPLAMSPYFHLHHWYAGWFVGMHANFEKAWWSRATMAWCWGCYINGIAVYGRDPVLTCGYALFISEANRCPFLDCYLDGIENNAKNETEGPLVQPMVQPDWRNCSADTYHP